MSVSGLVVTLSDDVAAQSALTMLAADPRLTLGDRFERRLAIVAETPSAKADLDLWDQLRSTPGITNVDVTFVHLDSTLHAPDEHRSSAPMENQHVHR